ncbi:MAG: RNA-binding protein [Lachnospiraceae bacterium]|nr:RNA-binding protein [Lachnospiraceae bacterium]
MIELGKWQKLKCIRSKDFGVYLGEEEQGETVLLPRAQVPEDLKAGGMIDVFVYRDSEDRLIATVNMPLITMEEIVPLKCVSVTDIGAFMDWGLERDIFLPFKEQTEKVKVGKEYLVRLYEDKTGRLCVSMRLYGYLSQESGYEEGNEVDGMVYETSDEWGAFVAVENSYSALIPKKELMVELHPGDKIHARIARVLPDGRLSLSLRKPAYLQMDEDEEKILTLLDSYDGVLPFTEKASPEVIKRELSMSKAAFKRAVGGLYKKRKIALEGGKIRKI